MCPNGIVILSDKVKRRFPANDDWVEWDHPRAFAYESSVEELVQEIVQRHAEGIEFREYNVSWRPTQNNPPFSSTPCLGASALYNLLPFLRSFLPSVFLFLSLVPVPKLPSPPRSSLFHPSYPISNPLGLTLLSHHDVSCHTPYPHSPFPFVWPHTFRSLIHGMSVFGTRHASRSVY